MRNKFHCNVIKTNKTCPNFNVREYLLNEDIKGYKFADSTVTDGDIQEMKDAGEL